MLKKIVHGYNIPKGLSPHGWLTVLKDMLEKGSAFGAYWMLGNSFLITVVIKLQLWNKRVLKDCRNSKKGNGEPPPSWDLIQQDHSLKEEGKNALKCSASASEQDASGCTVWALVQTWLYPSPCWSPQIVLFSHFAPIRSWVLENN